MGVVKTLDEAYKHFEDALATLPTRYIEGVGKADWKTPAGSDQAETNFRTQMAIVVSEKLRQKGIGAVDNKDWQDGAKNKGALIIAERIRSALPDWKAEWGPMYDSVLTVVAKLPPKTLAWRENINNRLVKVVEQWVKASGKS